MADRFVLGIDAGGTTVRFQFADAETGDLRGSSHFVAATPTGIPPAHLPSAPGTVVAVCAGITKYTRDGIPEAWQHRLGIIFPGSQVAVVPDYAIAFHGVVPEGSGVVVIAGTGSVAYGENPVTGAMIRTGGRGWEWGDEGSGAWLTTEMVRRTLRALDGQAVTTGLTEAVCAEIGTTDPGELAAEARRRAADPHGTGRGFLMPFLAARLQSGDAEAGDLFIGAGGWLSLLASTTAARLGFTAQDMVTISTVGGVWEAGGETLRTAFTTALKRKYPNSTFRTTDDSPTVGAVRIARKQFR